MSDSGAESCSEEVSFKNFHFSFCKKNALFQARIKTAEAFMTGIHSALTASIPDLRSEVKRSLLFLSSIHEPAVGKIFCAQ